MNYKICRVCGEDAQSSTTTINQDDNGVQLCAKLMYCTNLYISNDDGLPTRICDTCYLELSACYKFVIKCEETDKKLRFHKNLTDLRLELNPKVEIKYECSDSSYDDSFNNSFDNVLMKMNIGSKSLRETNSELTPKSKELKYQCSICGRVCANNSTLTIHMRIHTNEKPYPCMSCEKKYKDKGSLKRHNERNHQSKLRSRNYICESCGKSFFSKNDVKIHLRVHTGETPYACKECPMKFTQISAYLRHQKRHTGERNYICSICNKKFCTKEELKMHDIAHSNNKLYSCTICNMPFKYKNNLKKHMQLHSQPNSFVCNHCGRTFNVKGNLKIHISRIHSSKSGYCNICAKNVTNMEVHMWKHSGERPLKCELCSSSFYDVKALAHHVSFRHKNKDKYKCTYDSCTLAFPTKPMVDFHIAKLHETTIPFPCDKCSRGFYRKNDLARHKIGTHKQQLAST